LNISRWLGEGSKDLAMTIQDGLKWKCFGMKFFTSDFKV
jgi:hypothetical protein